MIKPVTPLLTADIIIELPQLPGTPIVLIRRLNPPPGWALPGGFVDPGESLEQAAVREAGEETGLQVRLHTLLGCYSAPDRDPRGHTASAVYIGHSVGQPKAADDAAEIMLCDPYAPPTELAFDHNEILADYRNWLETGRTPKPRSPH